MLLNVIKTTDNVFNKNLIYKMSAEGTSTSMMEQKYSEYFSCFNICNVDFRILVKTWYNRKFDNKKQSSEIISIYLKDR